MNIKKILMTAFIILAFAPNVLAMSFKEANAQNKPIVLYLYMRTCSACKNFTPIYEAASLKYSTKFNFVKEVVGESAIGKKLNPSTVPSVYLIEPKVGTTEKIDYECIMDQACFEKVLEGHK